MLLNDENNLLHVSHNLLDLDFFSLKTVIN